MTMDYVNVVMSILELRSIEKSLLCAEKHNMLYAGMRTNRNLEMQDFFLGYAWYVNIIYLLRTASFLSSSLFAALLVWPCTRRDSGQKCSQADTQCPRQNASLPASPYCQPQQEQQQPTASADRQRTQELL